MISKKIRDTLFRVRYQRGGYPISIGSRPFRVDPSLRRWNFEAEDSTLEVIEEFLQEGDTCIDVGANFGLHTLFSASCVGKSGKVFAFEPVPANLELLNYHMKVNHFDARTKVIANAVSNDPAQEIAFSIPEDGLTVTASLNAENGGVRVANCRLDDFDFGDSRIRFMKIDVEGAELEVLRGATLLIAEQKPTVLLEVHPIDLRNFGASEEDVIHIVESIGYSGTRLPGKFVGDTYHICFTPNT